MDYQRIILNATNQKRPVLDYSRIPDEVSVFASAEKKKTLNSSG